MSSVHTEIKEEHFTQNGRQMKRIITKTTTITTEGGSTSTSISTSTKTVQVDDTSLTDGNDVIRSNFPEETAIVNNDLKKMSVQEDPKSLDKNFFRKECLKQHNKYRAQHGAPLLVADDKLTNIAQEWADHLMNTKKFEHRRSDLGENIFWASGHANNNGGKAVEDWYSEIKNYDFNKNFGNGTGHFTQVVWKSSEALGVGVATAGRETIVVANYRPAGNMHGQYADNVGKKVTNA